MERGKQYYLKAGRNRRNGGNMQWRIQWHAADGQTKNSGSTIMTRFQTSLDYGRVRNREQAESMIRAQT